MLNSKRTFSGNDAHMVHQFCYSSRRRPYCRLVRSDKTASATPRFDSSAVSKIVLGKLYEFVHGAEGFTWAI